MCIRRWMVKKNVACIHNWILLSLEEEGTPVTWYTMGEAWGHYAKWNKPVTKMIIPLLYTPTYVYCIIPLMKRSESVSDLVVSNSLWPHGLWPTRLLCPWRFPGKNIGVAAISYSWASSWPGDQMFISCISQQILYPWATWEAPPAEFHMQ